MSNAIKSQLKVYFPLALELLDQDTSTALAADLLLRWPTLEAIQKQNIHTLRKFFYGHNCRGEQRMLERLELIQSQGFNKRLSRYRAGGFQGPDASAPTQESPARYRSLR